MYMQDRPTYLPTLETLPRLRAIQICECLYTKFNGFRLMRDAVLIGSTRLFDMSVVARIEWLF